MLLQGSRRVRVAVSLISVAVIGLLLLLIAAVDDISFQPRSSVSLSATPSAITPVPTTSRGSEGFMLFFRAAFLLGLIVLFVGILVSRRLRSTFLPMLVIALFCLWIADYIDLQPPPESPPVIEESEDTGAVERVEGPGPAPQPQYPTSSSQYLLAALALSSLLVGGIAALLWRKRRRFKQESPAYAALYDQLSDAAARLRAGEDPYLVVLYCYQEMIRVLGEKQHIDSTCLTPREFETSLRVAGLSDSHIHQLTEIFEIVRYGAKLEPSFPKRALLCLEAIQEAQCQG